MRIFHIIAKRVENEPFQDNLDEIRSTLINISSIASRTENKVDALSDEVKKLTGTKNKNKKEPPLPEELKNLLTEASEAWASGEYEKSKDSFAKCLDIANKCNNELAIAKSKRGIAAILVEGEKNPDEAVTMLKEALVIFRTHNLLDEIIYVLCFLGTIATDSGNLERASAYLSEAKEIAIKNDLKVETAVVFFRLGWLEDHKGCLDKALDYYEKSQNIYFSVLEGNTDDKTRKDVVWGIGGCYHLKGLIYTHKGDVQNVKNNFNAALDWYRKENLKPEMAKILFLLSELHFKEAEYDIGYRYLNESTKLYLELGIKHWYAMCLEMAAKVYYTLGEKVKAEEGLKQAIKIVREIGHKQLLVDYMLELGYVNLQNNEIKKAKKEYHQAKKIAYSNEFLQSFASSVKNLAHIAEIEKKNEERDKLLKEGINALEKRLLSVQSKPRQGFIIGEIGFFYELLSEFEQALLNYQKANKIFEETEDIVGRVNSLGSIARIKRILNKRNEEFDIFRELKKLLDGTPYYDLIAGTAINLGEIYLEIGNITEAKILLEEALFLCKKYNLHYLKDVEKSMKHLSKMESLRKAPELDLHDLIDELYGLLNWFPEAKSSLLRLWMWARKDELFSNYRNTISVKFMICQDDLKIFNKLTDELHLYGDLFLQVVSKKYPGSGLDIIPFPKDMPIFFECGCPTVILGGN